MNATKLFVACSAVLIVLSGSLGGVMAQSASGSELWEQLNEIENSEGTDAANSAFYSLSAIDQQAITEYLTGPVALSSSVDVVERQDSSSQSRAALRCWGATLTIEGRRASWPHHLFFKYHQEISWCGNGSTVSNVGCAAYSSNLGYGYRFSNHMSYCVTTVNTGSKITKFSQGSFCAGIEGCWVNRTPWLSQSGSANGAYGTSKGGL